MADLLLELGSEELPASFLGPALDDLEKAFKAGCEAARLTHGPIARYGTPRRLALLVTQVADGTPDLQKEMNGPSVKAAFDAEGKPTQAATKFAAGHGLTVDQLVKVTTPKGEYLAARVQEKGKRALEILPAVLHATVHGINFKKSMRWGDVDLSYARPLHWIVALLGDEVVPVVFADVKSGRQTRGHRFLTKGPIDLARPGEYLAKLRAAKVEPDIAERKAQVKALVAKAAERAGGKLLEDEALVDQVTNLVELPCPVVGTFEARHLDLPPEVLIQEMKSHQRYFSVVGADGKLLPRFIAVSNTPVKDEAFSVKGYERVLRSRLSDGRFFFDEDRRLRLEERLPKLERVVWQGALGSYREKQVRMGALAKGLHAQLKSPAKLEHVLRAVELSKADLVTSMVGEFPELQGVMGREYARHDKEPEEVALAIAEHYLPRGASDGVPTRDEGALVGLAERFDTIAGIFGIGKGPSGAADPFALRRACLAVIRVTLERGYRYSLREQVSGALALLEPKLAAIKRKAGEPAVLDQVLDFFRGRLKALWSEAHRADVVEAVLTAGFDDLVAAHQRLTAISARVKQPEFEPLAATIKRVGNIVAKQAKDVARGAVDPSKLNDAAEKALAQAVAGAQGEVQGLLGKGAYAQALDRLTQLKPQVDAFFDQVMVMAEDKALRENRVRLLMQVSGLFETLADFSAISA
ncbi:MAG: glycine--tRNA ligase subunit beta [Myxococcaceae bacterium]|nr:glycine--tRNA ligase subunit beta [Myxococcaceae bacterium]